MAGGSMPQSVSRQGIPASAERGLFLDRPLSRLIVPHQRITIIESKPAELTTLPGCHVLIIEMTELLRSKDMVEIRAWDIYYF
jgi:hypothetical protein